jgi:hypothetical protein
MQNVGQAAFMDALSIASSVAGIASGFGSISQGGLLQQIADNTAQ